MKKLEKYYKKYGYHFNQIFRDNNTAIYKQSDDTKDYGLEVFEIKIGKAALAFGKMQPLRELYPSSEHFGQSAFSVQTMDQAKEMIRFFKNRIEARQIKEAVKAA